MSKVATSGLEEAIGGRGQGVVGGMPMGIEGFEGFEGFEASIGDRCRDKVRRKKNEAKAGQLGL